MGVIVGVIVRVIVGVIVRVIVRVTLTCHALLRHLQKRKFRGSVNFANGHSMLSGNRRAGFKFRDKPLCIFGRPCTFPGHSSPGSFYGFLTTFLN